MADEKVVYLCNGTRIGVQVTDHCSQDNAGLTIDAAGNGTVKLVPQLLAPKQVDVKLLKLGDTVNNAMPSMDWEMVADSIDGDPPYWTAGARIHGTIPMACDWKESRIKSRFNSLPVLTQNPIPREIQSSKEQSLPDDEISTVTTYLIPGEDIWIEHDYSLTASNATAHQYWRTIAMTGGIIVDKWEHSSIEGLYQYDVDAEGTIYNDLLPTDYYPYEVGDWVFILTLTPVAVLTDREVLTPDKPGPSDQLRIAPYEIAGHGQYPNIKSYGASDFAEWGNMRVLYGIIQSILGDVPPDDHRTKQNYATVQLAQDDSIISDVPIKYWCQENSTDRSAHAFDPGDVVLIAFDGYRESPSSFNCTIIGHAASVYPCTTSTTTTTSSNTTTTTSSSSTTTSTTSSGTTTTTTSTCQSNYILGSTCLPLNAFLVFDYTAPGEPERWKLVNDSNYYANQSQLIGMFVVLDIPMAEAWAALSLSVATGKHVQIGPITSGSGYYRAWFFKVIGEKYPRKYVPPIYVTTTATTQTTLTPGETTTTSAPITLIEEHYNYYYILSIHRMQWTP